MTQNRACVAMRQNYDEISIMVSMQRETLGKELM